MVSWIIVKLKGNLRRDNIHVNSFEETFVLLGGGERSVLEIFET